MNLTSRNKAVQLSFLFILFYSSIERTVAVNNFTFEDDQEPKLNHPLHGQHLRVIAMEVIYNWIY